MPTLAANRAEAAKHPAVGARVVVRSAWPEGWRAALIAPVPVDWVTNNGRGPDNWSGRGAFPKQWIYFVNPATGHRVSGRIPWPCEDIRTEIT
jgi:hypothetical protein